VARQPYQSQRVRLAIVWLNVDNPPCEGTGPGDVMKVVFLYGPPGVGKLTVGTELAGLTGFKLIHNHLTVNPALALFPFGSVPWANLLLNLRRDLFAAAAAEKVDFITTGVYKGRPADLSFWDAVLEPVRSAGGDVAFVRLSCERDELDRRVQSQSRLAFGKIVDPQLLDEYWDLQATFPYEPHLSIESTHIAASEVAIRVVNHFDLPLRTTE
jgi:hypothetical protein